VLCASYFLLCSPYVYESFSDVVVLRCDFKKFDDFNPYYANVENMMSS